MGDIFPGPGGSNPTGFTLLGDKLIFLATDSTHGQELWATDGTSAGTLSLRDIFPGPGSSNPTGFTLLGNKLIFQATDPTHGQELWATDGTPGGTVVSEGHLFRTRLT